MNTNKPLSEWTLAEIKAECKKHTSKCTDCPFWTDADCRIHINMVLGDYPEKWDLSEPPRWTEQEVERVKAIKLVYPNAKSITKYAHNTLLSNEKGIFAALSSSLFPSLELYASIALDEIIGGAK